MLCILYLLLKVDILKFAHVLAVALMQILLNVVWLSYSGLHWDCLTVLMYFLDLQDMDAVFLEVWATDISKPIAVCFSKSYLQYPLPNISTQQYLMYIIFSILMCFRYLCFSIPECCAVVALVAIPFLQFFRKYLPFRIFIMKISRLKLLESLWDLNWAVLPIKIQQLGRVWKVLFISD